jgi:hypothetical protein
MKSNNRSDKKRSGWTEYEYPDQDDRGHIDDGLLIDGIYTYSDVELSARGCYGWDDSVGDYPCVELGLSTTDLSLKISMTPVEVHHMIDRLQTAIIEAEEHT